VVSDPIPANTTYVAGSITLGGAPKTDVLGGPDDECQFDGTSVICNAGTVTAAGGSIAMTLQVTVNGGVANGTMITNTATIASAELADVMPSITNTVGSAALTLTGTPTVSMLSGDQVLLEMPSQGLLPSAFNLYRGDLSVLRSSGLYTQPVGQGPEVSQFCQITGTAHTDAYQPQSGEIVFYLATAMSAAGEGVLGVDSSGAVRPHANSCP